MNGLRMARLFELASQGRLTRRQILHLGPRFGLASSVITALLGVAPPPTAAVTSLRRASSRRLLSRSQAESGGTFTALISHDPENIDPHSVSNTVASTVVRAAYETLIQLQGESTDEYEPMLAESWEVSEDGLTYTFKLFPDILFHDFTRCDAEAVRASFTRLLELGGNTRASQLIGGFVADPMQIEVVDPITIRFYLDRPQPHFLAALSSRYGPYVVSPSVAAEVSSEWFQENTAGTGPFTLASVSPDQELVFHRFDDYRLGWAGNHFDQIVFRVVPEETTRRVIIETGEADAVSDLPGDYIDALRDWPELQIVEYPSTVVRWAIMNASRLHATEARRGFSFAFPYDQVVSDVFQGFLRRTGPIPDTVRGYDPEVFLYPTDLELAGSFIAEAGLEEATLDYMFVSGTEEQSVAQLFQNNLLEIGLNLELIPVDPSTLEQTIGPETPAGERPAFMGGWGWGVDYNDPRSMLAPNFTATGPYNGSAWVNEEFEAIMAEAQNVTDENYQDELMREAQNILTDQDPPAIYYGQPILHTVLRSDIVGFYANPYYPRAYPYHQISRLGALPGDPGTEPQD